MSWVMVAVGASNAFNNVEAGKTAKGQASLQAQAMDYTAKIEQQNAVKTAELIRKAGRKQLGQATAAYAGAGVQVGEGSAAEVERSITEGVEHDAFQALLDGSRRARGLKTDASMTRIAGDVAQKAGYVNAAGSLLSSGYQGAKASGWRSAGPGWSGTQSPAPVETRTPVYINGRG